MLLLLLLVVNSRLYTGNKIFICDIKFLHLSVYLLIYRVELSAAKRERERALM